MARALSHIDPATAASASLPSARVLASGAGWALSEFVCVAGPGDRPVEERHDGFSIAAVVEGAFRYRGATGVALLHPGALLLGNAGACFECGHDHSRGDRCLALQFASDLFAEVSATRARSARFRFSAAMLGSGIRTLPLHVRLQALTQCTDPLAREASVLSLAAAVIGALSDAAVPSQRLSGQDEKRIARAIACIERRFREPLSLDELAAVAAMSKYHFLRTFRRVTGRAPHQYVLDVRLRHAGLALLQTRAPVAEIAFAAGFGDLSTFNARFRSVFRTTPSRFRDEA